MKISPILSRNNLINKTIKKKNLKCRQNLNYNNFDKITFTAMPRRLQQPESGSISSSEAIELFDNFKFGAYLDLNGAPKDVATRAIRQENLSFLEKVQNEKDKREFIEYYKQLTGFPNLYKVSENIKKEYINACKKAEKSIQNRYSSYGKSCDIVCAGYDGISSVARSTAFPGSDLDKGYVILRGADYDYKNEDIINAFKSALWSGTDQRILSYNHDVDSFPKVYTWGQIVSICNSIISKSKDLNLDSAQLVPSDGFFGTLLGLKKIGTRYDNYASLMKNYNNNYKNANAFMIDLLKKYESSHTWAKPLNVTDLSREDIYKAAFVLEALFKGDVLIGENPFSGKNIGVLKLINLSQIEAIKKTKPQKDKYVARKKINEEFEKWDINKQYDFIKEVIKAASGDELHFNEYFKSDTNDKFTLLLKEIEVGE